MSNTSRKHCAKAAMLAGVAVFTILVGLPAADAQDSGRRFYDDKLLRLSEILGAVHYLRALCATGEGQNWRDRMTALMDAEGTTAARRAMLTHNFNRGFRTYSRSYRGCTANAEATSKRLLSEATEITEQLLKTQP